VLHRFFTFDGSIFLFSISYIAETPVNILTFPTSHRDHQQGLETAVVTLVNYGDYQCPRSAEAWHIVQTIQQQLGEKLRFVYRHFPQIEIHPEAQHAAEAAEAAASQDKFWEMHHCLLTHQQALGNGNLVEYAIVLNLDVERFLREVTSDMYVQRVQEDWESGVASGVRDTPTFFVNGNRYDGNLDRNSLLQAIQRAAQGCCQRT
jgi:protein-disulfide isomerase